MGKTRTLIVGDNPFHGVSHFSLERARSRDVRIRDPRWAADIVRVSLENGAGGFMFSANDTTLGILKMLTKVNREIKYYAIVPAAHDYVRRSSTAGSVGLIKYVAQQTLGTRNINAIANGVKGVLLRDMASLTKAYLGYEISRIREALGRSAKIYSLMLHELVTEMAIAMRLEWLLRTHIEYLTRLGIKPGFETRNFVYLVNRLKELDIDVSSLVITTPFNALGFQMSPSRGDCERALKTVSAAEVIAMSILASGRLKLTEAADYLHHCPELSGAVIGVSSTEQARETFSFFSGT